MEGEENFSRALQENHCDNQASEIHERVYAAVEFIDELPDFPKYGATSEQLEFLLRSKAFRRGKDLALDPVTGGRKDNLAARKCLGLGELKRAVLLAEPGTGVAVEAFVRRGEAAVAGLM